MILSMIAMKESKKISATCRIFTREITLKLISYVKPIFFAVDMKIAKWAEDTRTYEVFCPFLRPPNEVHAS